MNKKKQKYWHLTVIDKVCVLCGVEDKHRKRVFKKPTQKERIAALCTWRDTACDNHF
jgi:hypothetical protein